MSDGFSGFTRRDGKNFLWLALISAVLFIVPLFFLDLAGGDETRVAGISAEMALDGDWLMPKLNGEPFLEYPPLYYAAVAAGYRLFGFIPFAAKLPTALAAVAGVLLLYAMMRILRRSVREAFAGAFMLATGAQYWSNAYDCRVDVMLTAFCILSWTGFAVMEFSGSGRARRFIGMLMLAAGIAGGMLTKNLPGIAIPLSGIGCAFFFLDLKKRHFSFCSWCRLAGAVVLGVVPYALYLLLLYRTDGIEAVKTVFIYNNFGRFSGANSDHSNPWWGYLTNLPELFQPYLLFLLGGICLFFRKIRQSGSEHAVLMLSFLLIPFLMLSAASGKRMVYLLPLAAPMAMIAAPALIWTCRKLPRRNAVKRIRRHIGILIGAVTLLAVLTAGAIGSYASHRASFAPAFAEAERLRREVPVRRLVLIRPSERLAGAAVFYHRAVVPQLKEWSDLKPGDVALGGARPKDPLPRLPAGFAAKRFPEVKLLLVYPASGDPRKP